jgi:hypothetical protein
LRHRSVPSSARRDALDLWSSWCELIRDAIAKRSAQLLRTLQPVLLQTLLSVEYSIAPHVARRHVLELLNNGRE